MRSAAACWNTCFRWRSSRRLTGGHYGSMDLNLLIAGVVLHDIGKIYELSYDRGFGYSPEGQLLGHIAIAIRMIAEKLRAFPEFPVELRNLIEHMVLSHHGQLEFGSPKAPDFPGGSAAALPRRHGFQDGVHAGADRQGSAGGRLFHRLTARR